jgi:hypothetical protein
MAKNERNQELWPKVLPLVRVGEQTVFVDLRLRQFRTDGAPLAFIDFSSEEGKQMCTIANVVSCQRCRTSVIVAGGKEDEELHCPDCYGVLR